MSNPTSLNPARPIGDVLTQSVVTRSRARSDAGLRKALGRIPELPEEFWHNLRIVGAGEEPPGPVETEAPEHLGMRQ